MSKYFKESKVIQNFIEKESYFAKTVIEELFLEYSKASIVKDDNRAVEILAGEANKEERISDRLFWTHSNSRRLESAGLKNILKDTNEEAEALYREISEYLKTTVNLKFNELYSENSAPHRYKKPQIESVLTVFLAITIYLLKNYDLAKIKLAFQKIQEVDSIEAADFWILATNDFDSSVPYEWLIASL